MTRLLINLFFIIIICFTLAAMPINTEILDMFDFGDLFSKEEPTIQDPETEDELDTFKLNLTYTLENNHDERLYNPDKLTLNLDTNLIDGQEADYNLEDFELVLLRNKEIYQIFSSDKFVKEKNLAYTDNFIKAVYDLDLSQSGLNLDQDGFYTALLRTKSTEESLVSFDVAYLSDFELVEPSEESKDYAYKAYFYNKNKTQIIPLSLNMNYPKSTTLAVRNSLYQVPTPATGLAEQSVIPLGTSLSRISEGYYGIYIYSSKTDTFITSEEEANLMVKALTETLLALPHIDKLTIYFDDRQVPGSFYNVDLSKVYEVDLTAKVYLPQQSGSKTYLMPLDLKSTETNKAIFEIIDTLQKGLENTQTKQILPPEVILNNVLLDTTQVTLDFNKSFLNAFPELEKYQALMIHSLLYSITSIEGIETVSITVDGEPLSNYGGFDFTVPVKPLEFINYIGQF